MPPKGKQNSGQGQSPANKAVWKLRNKCYETFFNDEETGSVAVYYIPFARFGDKMNVQQCNAVFAGPKTAGKSPLVITNRETGESTSYPVYYPASRDEILGEADGSAITVGETKVTASRDIVAFTPKRKATV